MTTSTTDTFDTLDTTTWTLHHQATHTGSDIQLVDTTDNTEGQLEYDPGKTRGFNVDWDFTAGNSSSGFHRFVFYADSYDATDTGDSTQITDGYEVAFSLANDTITLYEWSGGSQTELASASTTVDGGETFEVEADPNAGTIHVYKNSTQHIDYTSGVTADHATMAWSGSHYTTTGSKTVDNVTFYEPAAPSSLSASASADDVSLSWTDNSSSEDGFYIYRKHDGGAYSYVASVGADTTSYTDTGLLDGEQYTYEVTAYGRGESDPSGSASATTDLPAPSSVSQTVDTPTAITVSYTDNSDNETGFRIEVSEDGGSYTHAGDVSADTTSSQFSVSESTDTFQWRVRAETEHTTSSWASSGTVSTNVSGLSVDATRDAEIDLSWTDVDQEDGYHVYRAESSGSTIADYSLVGDIAAGTSSFTDSSLENGEQYYYRVAAVYGGSADALSGEVSGTTTLPATDFTGIETTDNDNIVLSFSPQDNSSDGSIEVYRSSSSGSLGSQVATVDDDATSYTDTGADVTQVHYYTLRRVTDHTSSDSQQWSTLLPPDGVSVDDSTYDTRAILSWTDAATTEVGYKIWYSYDSGSTWQLDADLAQDTTSYESSDVTPNADHVSDIQFKVEAYKDQDGDGTGETTAEEVVTASLTTVSLSGPYTLAMRLNGDLGQLSGDDARSVLATLKPTTQSQWEYETEYLPGLEDWAFSEIFLYAQRQDGGFALIMRGRLDQARSDDRGNSTTARGRDVIAKLTTGSAVAQYSGVPTHEAIRDYISTHLPGWTWPVDSPSPEQIASDELVQSADSTSEWQDVVSLSDDTPVNIQNGRPETLQTCFTIEGEGRDRDSGYSFVSGSEYSAGESAEIASSGAYLEWDFTPQYRIPAERVGVRVRDESDDSPAIEWSLNGTAIDSYSGGGSLGLGWADVGDGSYSAGDGYTGGDLQAGTTYTLRVEVTDGSVGSDGYHPDVVAVYDEAYSYTWDNTTDSNGYLAGPETKPDAVAVPVAVVDTVYNITAADVVSAWKDSDVSGAQKIEVSNTGGSSYDLSASNSTSVAGSFSTYGTVGQIRFTLGRYGSRTTATPTQGYKGQGVDSFELRLDGNDLSVLDSASFSGSHYRNLRQLHERAGYEWTTIYHEQELEAHSFPRGSVLDDKDWAVINTTRDLDTTSYFNSIEVRGKGWSPSSPTPSASFTDEDEANTHPEGVVEANPVKDPELTTAADCKSRARELVAEGTSEDELTGKQEVYSMVAQPGYDDMVEEWGQRATREKIVFSESRGDATGTVHYQADPSLVGPLEGVASGLDSVRDSL